MPCAKCERAIAMDNSIYCPECQETERSQYYNSGATQIIDLDND